jgi:DNA-directed RNA polymerase subunit RPC12/RpoP
MGHERDHEMRCTDCGARIFSSRAPALVAEGFRCPRCRGTVELAPGQPGLTAPGASTASRPGTA